MSAGENIRPSAWLGFVSAVGGDPDIRRPLDPVACGVFDPGCVKTHTVAKCRKNNSRGRHHASHVQYDLTPRYTIPSRSFYARSKAWSFYTSEIVSISSEGLCLYCQHKNSLLGSAASDNRVYFMDWV
jgi:hypothetical protein